MPKPSTITLDEMHARVAACVTRLENLKQMAGSLRSEHLHKCLVDAREREDSSLGHQEHHPQGATAEALEECQADGERRQWRCDQSSQGT